MGETSLKRKQKREKERWYGGGFVSGFQHVLEMIIQQIRAID